MTVETEENINDIILANEISDTDFELIIAPAGNASSINNPAIAYLMSLGSKKSQVVMASFLSIVARMIGYQSLRDCKWQDLRRQHIQVIVRQLSEEGRAPATVNTYLCGIKGVAFEAWSMGQISSDEFQHIKAVKQVGGSRLPAGRALSKEEVQALISACESDKSATGVRDKAILSVLVGCGLRRSEIVALNFESIDMRKRGLIVIGKGNKERTAIAPSSSWRHLNMWLDEVRGHDSGALFCRIRKKDDVTSSRLSDQAILYILGQRSAQAGIDNISPHDLRRTFASYLLAAGEDLMTIRDAMGHASIETTQRYLRSSDDRLKEASERMDSIFD